MSNEVKFIVSAETRQAAAALSSFLGNLSSGLSRVAGPLAALLSAGGLIALTRQSLNAADAMGKAAQLANSTAKEFTGMAYAADRDEVDLGSLRVALKELSSELSKTGQGSKNLKQALLEQSDLFASMPDGVQKNALAIQTFGRSGLQMIPFLNQGSASMREMFERGEQLTGINDDLAKSADEFNDALKDLHIAAQGLAGSLAANFIPTLTRTLNWMTDGILKFREWARESEVFRIGVQTLATTLGILAALKLGNLAVAGLSTFIGAGAIKSLADFIAALKLLPAAAAAAAASLGTLAAAIGAVTAAVTLASAWWDYNKANVARAEADLSLTQSTQVLTDALYRKLAAEKEAGKISQEEFDAYRRRIIEANKLADAQANAEALRAIKGELNTAIPGAGQPRQILSKDEFTLLRERDALDIAKKQANTEQIITGQTSAQAAYEVRIVDSKLAIKQIEERRQFTSQAFLDNVITLDEFNKLEIDDLTQIEQLEANILDLKTRRIQNNFLLTDAEKYDQMRAAGVPQDQLGPNPNSFTENLGSNLTQLQNQLGTFSQASAALITNGIGSAIHGIGDGIMGLIDGTRSWAQLWGSVLKQMATQGIQFMVEQLARFVLTKAKELVIHASTETAKTTATVTGAATRTTAAAGEAGMEAVVTGSKAASSVADIPYVGWALAIAAFAGVVAMIATAVSNARAAGGPVTAGQPYLVGEQGPEIFYAPRNGGILTNDDTMKVLSGGRGATAGGSGPTEVNVKSIIVANLQQAMEEALASERGAKIIVQTADGRLIDLGLMNS